MSEKIKQIKDIEKRHRLIADNLIDAVWVIDAENYQFEYMTESIEKMSGYTAGEYIHMPLIDRMSTESYDKIQKILNEEIPKFERGIKDIRTFEIEMIHKTGYLYWVEIRTRLYRENGRIKLIGVSRDITDKKKDEQAKDRLIDRLGKALAENKKLLLENKILKGLLPICSGCKRIRDEDGRWWPLDAYVQNKAMVAMTHTICTDCKDVFYGN